MESYSQLIVLSLPFWFSAAVVLAPIFFTWRHRREPAVSLFHITMICAAWWPASVALELLAPGAEWKFFLMRSRSLALSIAGIHHFLICANFAGYWQRHRTRLAISLWTISLAILSLHWAPASWHSAHPSIYLAPAFPHRVIWSGDPVLFAYVPWLYLLLYGGCVLLLSRWRDHSWTYRLGALGLLGGVSVPVLIDLLFRYRFSLWPDVNFAAMGMIANSASWCWLIWRCDILGLARLGRAELFESMSDPAFIVDRFGRLIDFNRSAASLLGAERKQWEGRSIDTLPAPLPDALTDPPPSQLELLHRTYSPHSSTVFGASGKNVGRLVLLHDVTEVLRLRAQLLDAYRFEGVGQLAGGIAHEFNNLLTVILGYAHLLKPSPDASASAASPADLVLQAGERAGELTRELLAYSRRQYLRPTECSANHLLASLLPALRQAAGPGLSVRLELTPDPLLFRIDRTHLEQALLEAIANARQATTNGTGEVLISTARDHEGFVAISIADNGPGVPVDLRERVFEPFFTTADPGQNAGLGLSMIHGFAAQSGGSVAMREAPSGGALLLLRFPPA